MEGLADPLSDLAATTKAGIRRSVRIASDIIFFISIDSPPKKERISSGGEELIKTRGRKGQSVSYSSSCRLPVVLRTQIGVVI